METAIILYDTEERHANLLPLSYTRAIADFRIGITTIAEKWEIISGVNPKYYPVEYLREHYGNMCADASEICSALFIDGSIIPDERIWENCRQLQKGEALKDSYGRTVAYRGGWNELYNEEFKSENCCGAVRRIDYVFDIFRLNGDVIKEDFIRCTSGRNSEPLSETNRVVGGYESEVGLPLIFIEEGAEVECAVLNTTDGPIYIGKDVQVQEGSCLRGPLAMCNNVKIKMGAKIYGNSTFGPFCKIGGEVDNSVVFGYSNKAHDGYLGNAVVGEWCNIGAGVNASNLKNNYAKIRIWNYAIRRFMKTDLQFCGLIMGDHSKLGVNCMLNTATVLGVGVNIHGAGFPRVFVPSFSEGSSAGFKNASMREFHDVAERVMARRDKPYTQAHREVFEKIYQKAQEFKS